MDGAHKLAGRLNLLLEEYFLKLVEADEERMAFLPPDGAWSGKQVMGHLIDSAANNHVRFVNGQTAEEFTFSGYDQDAWVDLQNYSGCAWNDLINLWHLYNRHLVHIILNIPDDVLHLKHKVHNLDVIGFRPVSKRRHVTLYDLVEDYIEHLEHHLLRLLDGTA